MVHISSVKNNTMASEQQVDLIIVSCLDPLAEGVIQRIPRHVTIVPWFSLSSNAISALNERLQAIAALHNPFSITGLSTEYFGPEQDILVRRIDPRGDIRQIHDAMLESVVASGGVVRNDSYTGDGYQPHITKQADGWLEEDEQVVLQSFQLIQAVDLPRGKRNVLLSVSLKTS